MMMPLWVERALLPSRVYRTALLSSVGVIRELIPVVSLMVPVPLLEPLTFSV